MALSKTHILVSALALRKVGGAGDYSFENMLPFIVMPDAMRCFDYDIPENNRVITHFEINPKTQKASWIKFPDISKVKVLDDTSVNELPMHFENGYGQVGIGDVTSIGEFILHNSHLPKSYFKGVLMHLTQDFVYDEAIRSTIDITTRRKDGIFRFQNMTFDKTSVRNLITEIEEQEFRTLAGKFRRVTGERPDMQWFEKNVKPVLYKAYSPKMAESTWKYISVDLTSDIPRHILKVEARLRVERMLEATIALFD